MRLWLSGPRILRGLVRPGISLGSEDFRRMRKPPAATTAGMFGVFRRDDGAIFLGMQGQNGEHEHEHGLKPVAAFAFSTAEAATEARDGALVRLAKHVAPDGLIGAQSVGQCVAAIRAEASALGLEARFIRVTTEAPETNARKPSHILAWTMIWLAIALIVGAVLHG